MLPRTRRPWPKKPNSKYSRADELEAEFDWFDEHNPHIWDEFQRLALQEIADEGQASARELIRAIRGDFSLRTICQDGFKINQNLAPFYARKFLRDYPEHAGAIRVNNAPSRNRAPRRI